MVTNLNPNPNLKLHTYLHLLLIGFLCSNLELFVLKLVCTVQ